MILPTKGISQQRCLLTIGAEILMMLERPNTPSGVWESYHGKHAHDLSPVTFDWFTLALAFLYTVGLIDIDKLGLLRRVHVSEHDRIERPALQDDAVS